MNKKVIERILKNLLTNEKYTLDYEESEILLNYIADLQRKEYNNSKAIEYIKECQLGVDGMDRPYMLLDQDEGKDLLNILEKGE